MGSGASRQRIRKHEEHTTSSGEASGESWFLSGPPSHRALLGEDLDETLADSVLFRSVATDQDNNLIFTILEECDPYHTTTDVNGRIMLVSVEPDKNGKTLMFSLTDAQEEYFYCVRNVSDIIQDKDMFLRMMPKSDEFHTWTQMDKWNLFMDALFSALSDQHFEIEMHSTPTGGGSYIASTQQASMCVRLDYSDDTFCKLFVPLKPLPQKVLKRRLPLVMLSLVDRCQSLEQSNKELKTKVTALEKERQLMEEDQSAVSSSTSSNKRPVFQAFPKVGGTAVPRHKTLYVHEEWLSQISGFPPSPE